MRVTFLGTGTSHGIPRIGCDCEVCCSDDPRNKRMRPSIFVENNGISLLVDATPDFRSQALRAEIRRVDAVLITHTHADHVMGLDDLRAFTELQGSKLPLYGSAESMSNLQRMFPYACTEKPAWPGLPSFELNAIEANREFELGDVKILPLPLAHGRMIVYGFLFDRDLAYVTDCNDVPAEVVETIRGVTVLVADALRHRPHPTHLTVAQALDLAGKVQPKLTLLTHLCHDLDHRKTENDLPSQTRVAYDDQQIEVENGEVREIR